MYFLIMFHSLAIQINFLTCAGHNFVLENSDLARGHYLWERSRWVVIRNCTLEQGTIRGGGEANIVQHGIARYNNRLIIFIKLCK